MEATKELTCVGGPMDGAKVTSGELTAQGSLIRKIAAAMQTTNVAIRDGLAMAKDLVWGWGDDPFGRKVEYSLQPNGELKFVGYLG